MQTCTIRPFTALRRVRTLSRNAASSIVGGHLKICNGPPIASSPSILRWKHHFASQDSVRVGYGHHVPHGKTFNRAFSKAEQPHRRVVGLEDAHNGRSAISDLSGTRAKAIDQLVDDFPGHDVLKARSSDRVARLANLPHRAFIALGSNMGDRFAMIEEALKLMQRDGTIQVIRTSSLWETQAMYVVEQDKFLNGACEIKTSHKPIELLDKLQSVEQEMGRVKVIDKGPRNIDLDILLYDQEVYSHPRLQIPHQLMLEREFVLRPLCELIPNETMPSKTSSPEPSFQSHLSTLQSQTPPSSTTSPDIMSSLTPIPLTNSTSDSSLIKPLHPTRPTRIMSIINLTPDSFSDGGDNFNLTRQSLSSTLLSTISSGAQILDLGGQSTRPGAPRVSPTDELSRILPAVKLIRQLPETRHIPISVDTFNSYVAWEAIKAGADIVNDVSAGLMDDAMLSAVAELGCTICLMHMRGTPETMSSLTDYGDDVVGGVGAELLARVQAAEAAGIKRWRIILDPGIGFAKTTQQNLELLRRLDELKRFPGLENMAWLVGTSRKTFVGKVLGIREPKDRVWGTAATVAAAVQAGADIVRVHDVGAMGEVSRMADAIWRNDFKT